MLPEAPAIVNMPDSERLVAAVCPW